MAPDSRHVVETTVAVSAANVTVWSMSEINTALSIALAIVSLGWVLTQWIKFVLRWRREERARAEGRTPTDYDKL